MFTYKYPRPALTTDAVVFGYDKKNDTKPLYLLLIERGGEPFKGCWALPGGFVNMDETVEEGARRELAEETGIVNLNMKQLHVFSKVDRDPRDRIVSVAFVATVNKADYQIKGGDDAVKAEWFSIDHLPPLAFDHQEIIAMAISRNAGNL